ncbi:DMT family transporter [Pontibacterium sp. N1Y112]|uniref:DMT family transporter n=1 Tax=Pontibacterium sinense TaxID=2781979 RepID=A0A8J7FAM3_9GAMM|nr:DMT family transporter [Pontibacterium sinense]MBE9396084.1 DMT family transporter [Pontibacterium sinense]
MNTDYMKGFLLTALGVLVLSFDALLIRLINSESFDLLFWRGLLLSVAVFFWCRYRKPEQALFSWDVAFIRSALLFAVSAICFVSAITLTSVANVLVIISAQPLFAAVMARIFLREKSSLVTWIAIIISMLGISWVLAGSWQSPNLAGDLIALVCGLALSAKFVNDRANSKRDMTPALILSGLIIAIISATFGSPFSLQGPEWGWMLLLCLGIVPLAFILITLGPMRIPAAEVSMLMLLETAMGPLWTWLWLDEVPGVQALQGGAVVIGTLLVHGFIQWRRNQRKFPTV